MPRTTRSRPKLRKRVTAQIDLRGDRCTFKLFTRCIPLGDCGTIDLYWMDVSQFRNPGTETSLASFRNCVAFWQAAGKSALGGLPATYVLAECSPLLCRSKSVQNVHRDAFLDSAQVHFTSVVLTEEERQRS